MRAAVETRIELAEADERTRIVVAPITERQILIFLQLGDVQAVSLYVSKGQAREILARLELWLRPRSFWEPEESTAVAANG